MGGKCRWILRGGGRSGYARWKAALGVVPRECGALYQTQFPSEKCLMPGEGMNPHTQSYPAVLDTHPSFYDQPNPYLSVLSSSRVVKTAIYDASGVQSSGGNVGTLSCTHCSTACNSNGESSSSEASLFRCPVATCCISNCVLIIKVIMLDVLNAHRYSAMKK